MSESQSATVSDPSSRTLTTIRGVPRSLLGGSVLAVLASLATDLAGLELLGTRMRIHWSLGGPFYGPEFAPTAVVLGGFTVTVLGVAIVAVMPARAVPPLSEIPLLYRLYTAAVMVGLWSLVAVQAALVLANL